MRRTGEPHGGFRKHPGVGGRIAPPGHSCGFTLIELLAVITCAAILVALCFGPVQAAMASAYKVREVNAARVLMAAYASTAADNNGRYLPGMDYQVNMTTNPVYKSNGQIVSSSVAARRYPFRLAPYLGDSFNGTILVNKNIKQIEKLSGVDYDYRVSAYPALGLNIFCVGGVVVPNGTVSFAQDCVTTPARMKGSILAFASAGEGSGGVNEKDGYCYVTPPTLSNDVPFCKNWNTAESWSANANPENYGYVDFRYDGKAVCAFLDGSVRMCSVEELEDMRVWSPAAAEADDPNWTLQPL